ncbi:hypothetical protein LEP3755_53760 [Leptolyngbya sp. NIES-3755]|nr:hypothetical protein LEP3755_53760 [Leptolyngbya sp. NIES-3755]
MTDNNKPIFTDLTEDEAAALNGGTRCFWVRVCRWVRNWYGFQFACVWAVRCY